MQTPQLRPADMRSYIVERLVGETAEPDKVIATARSLAERALPVIRASISDALPSAVAIGLKSAELCRMADAFRTRQTGALTVAASAASPDALIIAIDLPAISLLTGVMFGAGQSAPPPITGRPLSQMEKGVAALTFACVAETLNGSGPRALHVKFPLPAPISGEEIGKQAYRDGPAARLTFTIASAGGSGALTVTMPQRVVLSPRSPEQQQGPANEWSARFSGEVMRSKVALEALAPAGRLTLGEIAALRVGQILELSADAPGETLLRSRDKTLFVCEFGKLGQNYTVRIKQPFDAEQDFMNRLLAE